VFNRVTVWLDEYAPDKGAFAYASDWAARLHVPLHVVADSETTRVGKSFHDADLSVFSAALPRDPGDRLMREARDSDTATVMVCSATCRPAARTLIVDEGSGPGFLEQVDPLCRGLAIRPVVLSVAGTERDAEGRQGLARRFFLDRGLDADFDLIAGCDLRTAVARAARARGCSHVIVTRQCEPSWRRWLGGGRTRALLALTDKLTVVTLPVVASSCGSSLIPRDAGPCG
jgi:hypothetical protein